jgi:hypothetical protein
LIRGVERRIEVKTNVDRAAGRPNGLYGNRFAAAGVDTIRRATRKIEPATVSNLIAVAAPAYGRGEYQPGQIEYILETASTPSLQRRSANFTTHSTCSSVVQLYETKTLGAGNFSAIWFSLSAKSDQSLRHSNQRPFSSVW